MKDGVIAFPKTLHNALVFLRFFLCSHILYKGINMNTCLFTLPNTREFLVFLVFLLFLKAFE